MRNRSNSSIARRVAILGTVTSVACTAFGVTSASAAVTMTQVGSTATIVGDAAGDVLVLGVTTGNLRHNHSADPGFNSDIDFDSTQAGDQTLTATALTTLNIQLGAGSNSLILQEDAAGGAAWSIGRSSIVSPLATLNYDGDVSGITVTGGTGLDTFSVLSTAAVTPVTIESGIGPDNTTVGSAAGTLAPVLGAVKFSGGASTDSVVVNDSVGEVGKTYDINQEPGRTTLARAGNGVISWDGSVASLTLRGSIDNDRVNVVAPPATPTILNFELGRGSDMVVPAGVTNLGGGSIKGGDGVDTLDLSKQTDGVAINLAVGTAGAWGPATSVESVIGTAGDDTIVGAAGDEVILPGNGHDQVDAGAGDDTIIASIEKAGDNLAGGTGNDTIDYSNANRQTPVSISLDGLANDGIAGEASNVAVDFEHLIGGDAGDALTGSAHADMIEGRPGDDTIDGRAGNDSLIGGTGDDTFPMGAAADGADTVDGGAWSARGNLVSYGSRKSAIVVTLAGGADDGVKGEHDSITHVQVVIGGAAGDILVGDTSNNTFVGGRGNDRLSGGAGDDDLNGGAGNDVITGGLGFDRLIGGAGNDKLVAKAGVKDKDVLIDGGPGRDKASKDKVDKLVRIP